MTLPLAGVVMLGIAGRKRSKYSMVAGLCVALVFAGFLIACGSSNTPPTAISVSPEGATVTRMRSRWPWPSQTASFTATVTNNSNTAVSWSLSSSVSCTANPSPCGSVDANGNYTAPDHRCRSAGKRHRHGDIASRLNQVRFGDGYVNTHNGTCKWRIHRHRHCDRSGRVPATPTASRSL